MIDEHLRISARASVTLAKCFGAADRETSDKMRDKRKLVSIGRRR